MTIVVLGGGGFLGRAVLRAAIQSRIPITSFTRADVDVLDTDALLQALDKSRPTAIINCAVTADFSPTATYESMVTVNAIMPASLARWSKDNDCHLVQPSAAIIHGVRFAFASDKSTPALDSAYGRTKYQADTAIQYIGCSHSIVRFGGIYGAGGPKHLGLNNAIDAALKGTVPTIVGKGSGRRNYIHCDAAADALLFLASKKMRGVVYHGGAETLSISDMMHQICDVLLPDQKPSQKDGPEASDSLVAVDARLPAQKTFLDRLEALKPEQSALAEQSLP